MELADYIEEMGVKLISDVTNVSTMQVYNWKNLESIPRPATAFQLIDYSRGMLTWDGIYLPYLKSMGFAIERNGQLRWAL